AAVWLYVESLRNTGMARAVPIIEEIPIVAARPDREQIDRLRNEADGLRKQLGESERRLTELAGLPEKLKALEELQKSDRDAYLLEVKKLKADIEARKAAGDDLAGKVASAEERIASLEKEKKALQSRADELPKVKMSLGELQTRLAAATEEVARVRKEQSAVVAAAEEAKRQADLWKVREQELVLAFQQTYLASVAPGAQGLSARKTAASTRRMVGQIPEILPGVQSDSTRQLVNRLEVVLIRLEFLDTERVGAENTFLELLGRSDFPKQIDEALQSGGEPQRVRAWLLEAKLILMGAGHVG
ncbi:MAG: hypothetical protein WBF17_13000, partial [Phycisphaerae bacterium]